MTCSWSAGRPKISSTPDSAGTELPITDTPPHYGLEWALLVFDKPVTSLPGSVMISTKLDLDMEQAGTACRISFYGNVAHVFEGDEDSARLKLFRVRVAAHSYRHVTSSTLRCIS